MRASYALPGVFDPVKLGGRWLMDGALVNPIPVTVARALGADLVICVNLNSDIRIRGTVIQSHGPDEETEIVEAALEEPRRWGFFGPRRDAAASRRPGDGPGIANVMMDAFNITQDRICPLAARRRPARRDDRPEALAGRACSSSTAPTSASSSAARRPSARFPISASCSRPLGKSADPACSARRP